MLLSAVPAFVAETRFAGEACYFVGAPETREQTYLETLIAREDFSGQGSAAISIRIDVRNGYRSIFQRLYGEDRNLTTGGGVWDTR